MRLSFIAALAASTSLIAPGAQAQSTCPVSGLNVVCSANTSGGLDENIDNGTLTVNSGVTVTNSGDRAIDFNGDNTVITNRGSIVGPSGEDALRIGEGATLFNYGVITNADGDEAVEASSEDDITVNNYGTISTTGSGDKAIEAENNLTVFNAAGATIFSEDSEAIEADNAGLNVTNYGTIQALVDDAIDGNENSTIVNFGTISGGGNDAIELDDGTITNLGTIISTSSSPGETDAGIDFDTSSNNGTVTNSGLIEGDIGIGTDGGNTGQHVVTNSGMIRGRNGVAVDLGAGDDTFIMQEGGAVDGSVELGAGNDTATLENDWRGIVEFASTPETQNFGGSVQTVSTGSGLLAFTAENVVPANNTLNQDMAFGVGTTIARRTSSARTGSLVLSTQGKATRSSFWVQGFGARRDGDLSGRTSGAVFGYDRYFGDVLVGGFIGRMGGKSKDTASSASSTTQREFAGLYAQTTWQSVMFDGAISFGRSDTKSERSTGGGKATANYDGRTQSFELGVSTRFSGAAAILVPRVAFGVATHKAEGFTDSGGLKMGARTERVSYANIELASELTGASEAVVFSPFVGLWAGKSAGDSSVDASFSGTDFSIALDQGDVTRRTYAGSGMTFALDDGSEAFARIELGKDSNETFSGSVAFGMQLKF